MIPAGPGSRRRLGRRILAPALVLGLLLLGQAAFLTFTRTSPAPDPALPSPSLESEPVRIASVAGAVRVEAEIGTRAAREDEPLRVGERVTTGPDGRAEIEIPEVGSILLDAESILERTSTDGRGRDYFLHAGSMLVQTASFRAEDRPVFHTPHATFVADTGTENEFLVQAQP